MKYALEGIKRSYFTGSTLLRSNGRNIDIMLCYDSVFNLVLLILAWNVNMIVFVDSSALNGFKHSINNVDLSNHLVLRQHLCIVIVFFYCETVCLCVYVFIQCVRV